MLNVMLGAVFIEWPLQSDNPRFLALTFRLAPYFDAQLQCGTEDWFGAWRSAWTLRIEKRLQFVFWKIAKRKRQLLGESGAGTKSVLKVTLEPRYGCGLIPKESLSLSHCVIWRQFPPLYLNKEAL